MHRHCKSWAWYWTWIGHVNRPCTDSASCFASFSSYGSLDVRRKNATRESTSTLKAWLYEHIKNPYPTKGEKIMLAIITKMTLTQVSTWFANARRRLKKENKMQWSPRNRTDNEDDKSSCSDIDDNNSNKESHQPVKAGDRDTINDDTGEEAFNYNDDYDDDDDDDNDHDHDDDDDAMGDYAQTLHII